MDKADRDNNRDPDYHVFNCKTCGNDFYGAGDHPTVCDECGSPLWDTPEDFPEKVEKVVKTDIGELEEIPPLPVGNGSLLTGDSQYDLDTTLPDDLWKIFNDATMLATIVDRLVKTTSTLMQEQDKPKATGNAQDDLNRFAEKAVALKGDELQSMIINMFEKMKELRQAENVFIPWETAGKTIRDVLMEYVDGLSGGGKESVQRMWDMMKERWNSRFPHNQITDTLAEADEGDVTYPVDPWALLHTSQEEYDSKIRSEAIAEYQTSQPHEVQIQVKKVMEELTDEKILERAVKILRSDSPNSKDRANELLNRVSNGKDILIALYSSEFQNAQIADLNKALSFLGNYFTKQTLEDSRLTIHKIEGIFNKCWPDNKTRGWKYDHTE